MRRYFIFLADLRKSDWVVNITKVYAGDILTKVLLATVMIILIRKLSLEEYTNFTAFNTILVLFPSLVGSGINLALVQFSAERFSQTGQRSINLYLVCFLCELLLYIAFCALALLFNVSVAQLLFGKQSFDKPFIYGMLAGIGYLVSMTGISIYQAEENFNNYIKINWLKQGLTFCLIIILLLSNNINFQNTAIVFISVNILIACLITYNIFKHHSFALIIRAVNQNEIWNFFSASTWLIGYIFVLAALQRVDVFLLSHLSDSIELANYGVALQYYSLALLLLGSINSVLLPKFSKSSSQDKIQQRLFIVKWLKATNWTILPMLLLVLPSKPLFLWINGNQYESSFYILLIFIIGVWLSLMFSPLINILLAKKQFRYLFILSIFAFLFNLIGNYLLIPFGGGIATASISVLSIGAINCMAYFKCKTL